GRVNIVPLGERLDASGGAFVDTAAEMRQLDLVITCDTAVAHVAGALAVPEWAPLPAVPDWRWRPRREDAPWPPALRLRRRPMARGGSGLPPVPAPAAEFPRGLEQPGQHPVRTEAASRSPDLFRRSHPPQARLLQGLQEQGERPPPRRPL